MLVIWPFVIVTPVFTVVKDVGVAGMTTPFCMRAGLYVVGTGISRPTVIENERTTGAGPPISITFLRAATGRRAVSGVDTGVVEGVADGSGTGVGVGKTFGISGGVSTGPDQYFVPESALLPAIAESAVRSTAMKGRRDMFLQLLNLLLIYSVPEKLQPKYLVLWLRIPTIRPGLFCAKLEASSNI